MIFCTHIPVIVLPEETGLGSRPHVLLSSSTFLLQVQSGVSALHLSLPGRRTRPAPCLGLCRPSPFWRPSSLCQRSFQNRRHEPQSHWLLGESHFTIALAFRREPLSVWTLDSRMPGELALPRFLALILKWRKLTFYHAWKIPSSPPRAVFSVGRQRLGVTEVRSMEGRWHKEGHRDLDAGV